MKRRILLLAVIIAFFSFGCNVTINASTSISILPSIYNFGSVIVNDAHTKDFKIRNTSGKTITITSIEMQGAGKDSYSITSGGNIPINLLDGREHNLTIEFAPKTEGNQEIQIIVTYNNGESTITASINGIGTIHALFDIKPSNYDFENVGVGATVEKIFKILNKGNEVLVLYSLVIQNDASTSFNITLGMITDPVEVNPGTEYEFAVAFSPASVGSKSASFIIVHSAESSPYEGSLNGTGSNDVSISPGSYDFDEINVGDDSDWFTFTVTNPTAANVSITRIQITGTDSASFKSNPTGIVNFTVSKSGGAYEVNVKFDPIKAGNMTAELKITFTSGTLTANLYGEGVTNPRFNISPQSHDFGAVILNTTIYQVFTISNDGSAGLTISKIIIQDDIDSSFSISKGGVPTTINPGQTHVIEIKFYPQTRGDKTASIRIEHNATNKVSPFFVGLQGKGSEISLQPSMYDFGNVNINPSTKPVKTFTLTNTSTSPITITDIALIGTNASEFNASPSGSGSWVVNAGSGTFDIDVICNPTIEGIINAALQVSISAGNPLSASLSATGVANPVFKINPTVKYFGSIRLTNRAYQTFIITNIGTGTLQLSEITITDDADSSFSFTTGGVTPGSPVVNVNAGQTHEVIVKFEPQSFGQKSAKIHIVHNGVGTPTSPVDVNLSGSAVGPDFELIPMGTSYYYGHQIIGKLYRKSFYIRNRGDASLNVSAINIATGTDYELKTPSLPLLIQPGQISVVEVNFKPTVAGTRNDSVTFYHNSINSPFVVSLSGIGVAGATDHYEDFDGGSLPNGWGATGDWEWGVQTSNGPTTTHTGTKCWATRLNRNYRANQYCYLVTPVIDMSAAVSPKAEFWLWLDTANNYYYRDGIWMEMSTDGGNTWTRTVNPTPSYNSTVSSSIPAYVGVTTNGWEKISMDISAAAGSAHLQIAWYFYSDYYYEDYGAFIDTFKVYDTGNKTPNNPTPKDNDFNVKYTTSTFKLQWDCDEATTYDVYFGQTTPPTVRVVHATPNKFYNVSVAANKKYYWKVVATSSAGIKYSPHWCFHTTSSMPKVFINEIDTISQADWVEIYNADTIPASISGWQFTTYSDNNSYEDGTYSFDDYFVLQPGQAIVIFDEYGGNVDYKTEFNYNWANVTSAGEVILRGPKNYDYGIDYMKFNTLYSHKPSDLNWYGTLISNNTGWSNFYRSSSTDSDSSSDWGVRSRTADMGSKNPGQ